MREYNIVVIGLGPAGLSLLYFLKKLKFNGNILSVEAKREVGLNKHCAGLVSSSFVKFMWPITKRTIINKLTLFTITTFSTKKEVNVKLFEEAYVIDRVMYEKLLYEEISTFSDYIFKKQAIDIAGNIVNLKGESKVKAEVIIVAEGSVHRLRRKIFRNIRKVRKVFGIQEDIVAKPQNTSSFTVVFTDTYAKGFFGWVIPLSDKSVRVGIGGVKVSVEALRYFVKLLVKRNFISEPIKYGKPFGGIILTTPPSKTDHRGNVIFLGDSGLHVKPITGGGLYIHSLFSKSLAKSLATINNLSDASFLRKYYNETSSLRRKLKIQGLLAKILHELSERTKTEIVNEISNEEFYLRNYDFHEEDILSFITKSSFIKSIIKHCPSIMTAFLRKTVQ